MRKFKLLSFFTIALSLSSTIAFAANWEYNSTTSKWEKNITPATLNFSAMNTASLRTIVMPLPGGGNPTPAITNITGEDLTNGFFGVTGGQISAGDVTDPTNVRKAFTIADTSLLAPNTLRFAQSSATVTDDKAGKFLGFVNLNFYIPSVYNYNDYKISFKSRIYNPATFKLEMQVFDMGGSQLGTTQTFASTGWSTATFEQTTTRPYRFKMLIPNTGGLFAYYETPELMLTSATEPIVREISVTKVGNGTVSAASATVRDQDTQVFTLTPASGESLVSVAYNEIAVTATDNGDGTYSFKTPLLSANATLHVVFSGVATSVSKNAIGNIKYSAKNGNLLIQGLEAGQRVSLYSLAGQKIITAMSHNNEMSFKIESGIYILKVNQKSMKIVF